MHKNSKINLGQRAQAKLLLQGFNKSRDHRPTDHRSKDSLNQ